ncbi:MAG: acylphosphatase [Eubacteriales bacterium]|nr:acylphosphatase [Eubacteriales bacterium]
MIRRHYIIKGTVQGVGFRYRAYHAAEHCGVTGWVRNLYDGSVEMEAEGDPEDIREMFSLIERGPFINIEDMEVKEIPIQESRSFEYRD